MNKLNGNYGVGESFLNCVWIKFFVKVEVGSIWYVDGKKG